MFEKKMKKAAFLLALAVTASGCGVGDLTPIEVNIGTVRETERPKQKVPEKEEKVKKQEDEEPVTHSISEEKYAYETLDEGTKKVYDEILDCILEHTKEVTVSTKDPEVIAKAYNAVFSDYGGLFWMNGYIYTKYTMNDEITELTFTPKYTCDRETRDSYQKQVDEAVEELLAGISITDSDYAKTKYVYETLINTADYDTSAENNQNILSVFLGHATVCQGYSNATQYLLNQLGVESVIVTGTAKGESHAWVAVKEDDAWYYVDTTFGNTAYSGQNQGKTKYVNYSYLNITEEELLQNHEFDWDFPLPECTATRDNYYVQEGLYFTDFDTDRMGECLKEAWHGGVPREDSAVSWKFSESELYDQVFEYFITNGHIADWCEGLSSYHYVDDEYKSVLLIGF